MNVGFCALLPALSYSPTDSHQEEGVMFAALYWEEPDASGHKFGPDNTTAIGKTLKEVRELLQKGF